MKHHDQPFTHSLGLFLLAAMMATGCASAPKAVLPATANPNEEITRLRRDLATGEANDFAVLDRDDFVKSREHLEKAEDKLRNNKSQNDVLDELSVARGFYEKSEINSRARRSLVESVLDARSKAISAGAMKFPQTRKELGDADQDLRSLAEASRVPGSERVQKMQKKYSDVQMNALEIEHLGPAHSMIEAAKHVGGDSRAPETYNQAKVDYLTAKNALSTNRENPAGYAAEVRQANLSADTLNKVMEISKRDGSRFNEREAVRIVWQDRRINSLGQNLAQTADENARIQYEMKSQSEQLRAQQADLADSQQKIALQKALRDAQEQFTQDEAEVYQQGDNLLIRLKSIGFAPGKTQVPDKSEELLTKVETVVKDLHPSAIVVQGHTDSTGTKKKNEKLSEKRAEEVASILKNDGIEAKIESKGYGDSKPLATNKTKEGRAQNRRIDIIVTPSESGTL